MGISYGYDTYTFAKNPQGDVIGIYSGGTLVAKYEYSAYGQILSITNASGADISNNATHIANLNPFRYRGYYYDTETGFYYLQSRYYDPVVGRFLNADAFVSTGQGILGNNMFAYCLNNPVMCCDNNGKSAALTVPALPGLPFFSPLEDAMEFFVNGFLDAIDGGIKGIRNLLSERSRIKEQQESQERAKAREKAKLERKLAELKDGYCIIIGIYNNCATVTRGPLKVKDAYAGVRRDLILKTNAFIPANCENWGIYAFSKYDALKFMMGAFQSVELHDGAWVLSPHYHTIPHFILHNGIQTNVHAWFITE